MTDSSDRDLAEPPRPAQSHGRTASRQITAGDVAREAGVSRWTVNRAFRADASISNPVGQKVMTAAEKLGYAPDLLASSLRSDRSNLVALLIDDFVNPHKLIVMDCLTRQLRKSGWDTLLVNTLNNEDGHAALLNASQRRVDAAVLLGLQFNEHLLATALGARRIGKMILFGRQSPNPNTISICCDDVAAMEWITNYILARGYRRPLFMAGPQNDSAHLLRKDTFVRRWRSARGTEPDSISVPDYDPALAYRRLARYLDQTPASQRPGVVVCEADALAIGAIDAIRYHSGLRVPQDIAVTGFDDVPLAAGPTYSLTSYRQPIHAMAEALVDVLEGQAVTDSLHLFSGAMVVRNSA